MPKDTAAKKGSGSLREANRYIVGFNDDEFEVIKPHTTERKPKRAVADFLREAAFEKAEREKKGRR